MRSDMQFVWGVRGEFGGLKNTQWFPTREEMEVSVQEFNTLLQERPEEVVGESYNGETDGGLIQMLVARVPVSRGKFGPTAKDLCGLMNAWSDERQEEFNTSDDCMQVYWWAFAGIDLGDGQWKATIEYPENRALTLADIEDTFRAWDACGECECCQCGARFEADEVTGPICDRCHDLDAFHEECGYAEVTW